MKKILIPLIAITIVNNSFGFIVHDPATCAQVINNGTTSILQLNTATRELSTVNNTLALAEQNSQMLNISNWSDISNLITTINAAANMAQSMTWATSDAVWNFAQLFPGDSKTANYLEEMSMRSSGTLSTFRGNLGAVQGLGNALTEFKSTLTHLNQAQGFVQGHLSAAEQGNQIQGNILNTEQSILMSQMSAASDASAFYAYQVQEKQIEVESNKRFISGIDKIDPNYKNEGQGAIPNI
ncbi:MAG TPA: hypothetical protein DD381_13905 [Lentisphaeria bacterium]|nr:MAG: hypothetical protein A2X47_02470 [Lentisphaerae bacterium GWF2_38_69]HBM17417.1 hypothetical protein [Lentisphaeria bacterium]